MSVEVPFRRAKLPHDPDIFEKFRDAPPVFMAMILSKYALLFAESSINTTSLHHNTAPLCIAMLLQKYEGQGSLEHPQSLGCSFPV